jgi:hypothetical protein
MNMVNEEHLTELCDQLRVLLDAELAAGNAIVETFKGWPLDGSIFVMLGSPFRCRPASLPEGVTFREINDPHWWKASYQHEPSQHCLACRF